MTVSILRVLRWVAGGMMFIAAAVVAGQLASRAAPGPSGPAPARASASVVGGYSAAKVNDDDVQTALQFALSEQKRRNRSAVTLLSVLAAERQAASGTNVRLCLSIDRHGQADSARVVVHRAPNNRWSVTLWAWSACGPATSARGALSRSKGGK
jgi:hypothetical protein